MPRPTWLPSGNIDEQIAKVPGGWVLKVITTNSVGVWNHNNNAFEYDLIYSHTITFIPDLDHTWDMVDLLTGVNNG